MGIRYVNPSKMKHPYQLSEGDFNRIEKALNGNKTIMKSLTSEELESFQDHLYEVIAARMQTHDGSTALQ